MAVKSWLVDKSAYVRLQSGQAVNLGEWNTRIQRGLLRVCTVTCLELGYSVRNAASGRAAFSSPPLSLMPVEYLSPAMENRACEVQMLLAEQGLHRAPSIPDLLVAAVAEKSGLTVLAAGKDFDVIAKVTGQPVETLKVHPHS